MMAFYNEEYSKACRLWIDNNGENLNQTVKRANELAIIGKLDQFYYDNLLYPRIMEIQKLICDIKDEQSLIVKRLIRR